MELENINFTDTETSDTETSDGGSHKDFTADDSKQLCLISKQLHTSVKNQDIVDIRSLVEEHGKKIWSYSFSSSCGAPGCDCVSQLSPSGKILFNLDLYKQLSLMNLIDYTCLDKKKIIEFIKSAIQGWDFETPLEYTLQFIPEIHHKKYFLSYRSDYDENILHIISSSHDSMDSIHKKYDYFFKLGANPFHKVKYDDSDKLSYDSLDSFVYDLDPYFFEIYEKCKEKQKVLRILFAGWRKNPESPLYILPVEMFSKIIFLSFNSVSHALNWKINISDYIPSFVFALKHRSECKSLKQLDECKIFFKYFIGQSDFVSNKCIDEHIVFYGWKSIFDELGYKVDSSINVSKIDFPINIYETIENHEWNKKDYIKMKKENLKKKIIKFHSIQKKEKDVIALIDKLVPLLEILRNDVYNKDFDVIKANIIKIQELFSSLPTEFLKKYIPNLKMYGYQWLDEIRKLYET